jgi:hypothetical protein
MTWVVPFGHDFFIFGSQSSFVMVHGYTFMIKQIQYIKYRRHLFLIQTIYKHTVTTKRKTRTNIIKDNNFMQQHPILYSNTVTPLTEQCSLWFFILYKCRFASINYGNSPSPPPPKKKTFSYILGKIYFCSKCMKLIFTEMENIDPIWQCFVHPYHSLSTSLITKTPWSESARELYRPSDRRLSAKWSPTFADRGCHVVSVTDPYGRILRFLHRSRYFSIK